MPIRWRNLWSKTWTLETETLWRETHEESVLSYMSSLWVGDLIADEGDSDTRNVQTVLADCID
jgi:hypothetical protein